MGSEDVPIYHLTAGLVIGDAPHISPDLPGAFSAAASAPASSCRHPLLLLIFPDSCLWTHRTASPPLTWTPSYFFSFRSALMSSVMQGLLLRTADSFDWNRDARVHAEVDVLSQTGCQSIYVLTILNEAKHPSRCIVSNLTEWHALSPHCWWVMHVSFDFRQVSSYDKPLVQMPKSSQTSKDGKRM